MKVIDTISPTEELLVVVVGSGVVVVVGAGVVLVVGAGVVLVVGAGVIVASVVVISGVVAGVEVVGPDDNLEMFVVRRLTAW